MDLFLKKLFFFSLPLFGILIGNILIKKNDISKNGAYEKKLAEILASNQNATMGKFEYNDRLFNKYLIEQGKSSNIILLGASTMLEVGSKEWGSEVLNLSLTTCMLIDIMGVLDLLDENNQLPKTIVLGLIPVSFNKNVELGNNYRSKSIMSNYTSFCKKLDLPPVILDNKLDQLKYLNPIVLKNNYLSLKNQTLKLPTVFTPDANINSPAKIYSDGSKSFSFYYDDRPKEEIVQLAMAESYNLQWTNSSQLDPLLVQEFEKMVDWLQQKGIEVVFFLLPVNPVLWEIAETKGYHNKYTEPEDYLKGFANKKDIFIFGTFDPINHDIMDFFDDKHLKLEAIQEIIDEQMPLFQKHLKSLQAKKD